MTDTSAPTTTTGAAPNSPSGPSAPSNTPARLPMSTQPGAFRIGALHDPNASKWLNMLIYGAPGGGKTTLLGSAVDVPELNDVLFVSAERGHLVLENNPRVRNAGHLDVVPCERIEQLQKIYEFLKTHCQLRDQGRTEDMGKLQSMVFGIPTDSPEFGRIRKYRTVIIDSLTEIEAHNLAKILNLDDIGIDAGEDMEVAGFPQFRKNNHIIQRIVRQFRDLPMHVLFVCSQQYNQDELKRFHYAPALTGKLTQQVQGFMDIVGWLVVGAPDPTDPTGAGPRRLFVQPQSGPKADAKCRLASYGKAFFDNPTMADIMKATGFIQTA